ncbi:hypothetical protein [Adlercreutzia caecimuris]|uniref:hypothetical protein n=1 Tax=Adlercreutzia caecimuris TaxID=671266 RepID=UPI00258DAF64|nr:hypothetical protein [Adlercreutzia caecimuris]
MTYTPPASVLRGASYAHASCCGMPHVRAAYTADDIRRYESHGGACPMCGLPVANVHHEPPRSFGSFLLRSPSGIHVLKPALISLCGSGTTGCHGLVHHGLASWRWEWDSDEWAERWWSGDLLRRMSPHDPGLYELGRWVVSMQDGSEREVRPR